MHSFTVRAFGAALLVAPLLLLSACGSESQSSESEAPPAVVVPTVTISANPTSVTPGGSSMITWSSTNAATCTASGGWTGSKAANGSGTSGALSAETLFSLTCTGENGQTGYGAVTVGVSDTAPMPIVTLTANPTSVTAGGSSTLTWSSQNSTSCTASGGWTGTKNTSGTASTGTLNATTTFTLMCTGAGGNRTVNTTVTVGAAGNARPTANAGTDQTVSSAQTGVRLSGTGTDTDGTIASYAWTQTAGTAVTLSSMTVRNPTFTAPTVTTDTTLTFSLTVKDNAGSTSAADTVNVTVQGPASQPTPSQPLGYYTDMASAPVGAWVTAYGTGFGTSGTVTLGGTTQTIRTYSDTKVVFTVSGSGGALMVGGKSLGNFAVHTGRLLEATASNFGTIWNSVMPGDVIYMRAGTYNTTYGEGTWYQDCTLETYKDGTSTQPIAVIGYPGETVTWRNAGRHSPICLGDANHAGQKASWITFADFNITGDATCIDGGGDTTVPAGGPDETGATNIRIVGIRCEITDTSDNTMTGMISIQGDGAKILGNTFINNPNRVIINNNHGIYIQNGADDVEVAYNIMDGLRMGHVIQIHQDGTPKLYERLNVHDNHLQGLQYGDMRGISVVNIDNASTVLIERNVFRHQGQGGWGCINLYRGQITVNNNDCRDSEGGINVNGGYSGSRTVTGTGNAVCPISGYSAIGVEGGASSGDISLTGALSCN
ncbi:MAG TPA: hypothetical protein VMF52_10620 [Steroidobacteraceae bacterium]|nr:hypothetical protein [Steroidobacteraceae bacterium]